ncbi:MAG: T9SS type A sorting domain-containing protein [Flavobacteriales bacterium]|nr:T9SS type A sorting domain-containing protein [Flavobacteriales bacterium]
MFRFVFVALVFIPTMVLGQITITKSNMPTTGTTVEYSTASAVSTTIDVSKTGANYTWDFSDIQASGNGTDEFLKSSQTPYILNFGFTAIGQKLRDSAGFGQFQFQNIYNFFQSTNSAYSDVGIGFQLSSLPIPQSGKHTDPDEIYVLPLQYGDFDSTNFDLVVPISAGFTTIGKFFRSGNRVTTVDGWGKITTPYLNNVDCIRLKSVITEYDSVSISSFSLNFGQTVVRVEYKWLVGSEVIPALALSGTEVAGQFRASNITYRDEWSSNSPIAVDFEADKTLGSEGEIITFTNTSFGLGLTYNWTITPTAKFVNGTSNTSENPVVLFQNLGKYSVKLVASNGNAKDSMLKTDYITIDVKEGISELGEDGIQLYPNPAGNQISIQSAKAIIHTEIFDLTGKSVLQQKPMSNQIDVSMLQAGLYVIKIEQPNGFFFSRFEKK